MDSVWQDFLTIVREEVGSRALDTWFKALELARWDSVENTVYLRAPNSFVCDWVRRHYGDLCKTHLCRLLHVKDLQVVFSAESSDDSKKTEKDNHPVLVVPACVADKKTKVSRKLARSRVSVGINVNYTFETFVVGPSNSLAYAAAQAVADNPGMIYNPLFIYGGSGLGKTHLLHAIGNAIQSRGSKASILYQTTDRFVTDFINAIRFDKVNAFQKKYQSVDVLLIDDVQFICNKDQTQEAFFHLFNTLYDLRKQIVFSSDVVPHSMTGIAERLRSRLAWGLVTDIHTPHLETRIAILKKKASINGVSVANDDVLYFIAAQNFSNVRELEGALIRVSAYASLMQESVTLDLAHKVLSSVTGNVKNRDLCLDSIINRVCKYYQYSVKEVCSKNRNKNLSSVRDVAVFLMKKLTDKSLREIGKFLGGRDHSTIMHSLEKVNQQIVKDAQLRSKIEKVEHDILNG